MTNLLAFTSGLQYTAGVSNTRPRMRPAKLFCAARGQVHKLKNILDKNYLYYPFQQKKYYSS